MNILNKTCRHPHALWISITLIGVLLDQLTKLLVSANMALYDSIPVWEGVFHITYIQNRGAAWGMFADRRWVFLIISSITIVAMLAFFCLTKNRNLLLLSSVAMILSGGIGNMIDRLALGYVVDMIHVALINFPVFNVADCFVCVGAALLFIAVLFEKEEAPTAEDAAPVVKENGEGAPEEPFADTPEEHSEDNENDAV